MNLGCDPTKLLEADSTREEAWVTIREGAWVSIRWVSIRVEALVSIRVEAGTRNTISSPDMPTGLQAQLGWRRAPRTRWEESEELKADERKAEKEGRAIKENEVRVLRGRRRR